MKEKDRERRPSKFKAALSILIAIAGAFVSVLAAAFDRWIFVPLGLALLGLSVYLAINNGQTAFADSLLKQASPDQPGLTQADSEGFTEASGDGPLSCPYCGRAVEGDFDFCPKCGRKLPDRRQSMF